MKHIEKFITNAQYFGDRLVMGKRFDRRMKGMTRSWFEVWYGVFKSNVKPAKNQKFPCTLTRLTFHQKFAWRATEILPLDKRLHHVIKSAGCRFHLELDDLDFIDAAVLHLCWKAEQSRWRPGSSRSSRDVPGLGSPGATKIVICIFALTTNNYMLGSGSLLFLLLKDFTVLWNGADF